MKVRFGRLLKSRPVSENFPRTSNLVDEFGGHDLPAVVNPTFRKGPDWLNDMVGVCIDKPVLHVNYHKQVIFEHEVGLSVRQMSHSEAV